MTYYYIEKSLTFYIERYILNDDGGWDYFIVWLLSSDGAGWVRRADGGIDIHKRGGTASGRKIRVVVGRKGSPL